MIHSCRVRLARPLSAFREEAEARRRMMTTEVEGQPRDEISDYIDMRSVGSSEAAWLLFAFPITSRYPAVIALRVHLKEEQQIIFDENLEIEALENQRETELTAFFSMASLITCVAGTGTSFQHDDNG